MSKHICIGLILLAMVGFFILWAPEIVAEIEFSKTLKKALGGDVDNQLRVALLYDQGKFIKQDKNMARLFYETAAGNGNETAMEMLENYR